MLLSDAWLEEGVRGSISSSNSGLFWAVFRPPDPGGRPPKKSLFCPPVFFAVLHPKNLVFRTPNRFSVVFRPPGPPPDTLLETYSSPE